MSSEKTPQESSITHIYILLDRSGSMSSIARDVIGGFNQFIEDQTRNGPDARVTLVQFDNQDPHEVIFSGVPIVEVKELKKRTFVPRGGTPLLDATGLLIGRARVEAAARAANGLPQQHILFVSVTDGGENQSHEYSLAQIKTLFNECEQAGWTFVFISAALDAYADADRIGVRRGSSQSFASSPRGTRLAWQSVSDGAQRFRDKKRQGLPAELDDFFGSDKPAEDHRNNQ